MLKTRNILDITNPKNQKVLRLQKDYTLMVSSEASVVFSGEYMSFRYYSSYDVPAGRLDAIPVNREYFGDVNTTFQIWLDAMSNQRAHFGYIIARGNVNSISTDVDYETYITYP